MTWNNKKSWKCFNNKRKHLIGASILWGLVKISDQTQLWPIFLSLQASDTCISGFPCFLSPTGNAWTAAFALLTVKSCTVTPPPTSLTLLPKVTQKTTEGWLHDLWDTHTTKAITQILIGRNQDQARSRNLRLSPRSDSKGKQTM